MELRPHQSIGIEMIRQSMRMGNKRIMLAACCSYGKTLVAGTMLQEAQRKGKRGIFICDRVQLVDQALERFEAMGMECGVIQASHEKTNPGAPIQIASVQTLARRGRMAEFDFGIIEEAHGQYKTTIEMMATYSAVPFIGLSATPYSKGLGKYYQDLVVPITTRQMLDKGWLCPTKYFAGAAPDLEKVKLKKLPSGGMDYDPASLSVEMEKPKLIGNVVKTWIDKGENLQTIAFCPTIAHSQGLVKEFNDSGVRAVHIDAYTDPDERRQIYKDHNEGLFKILSCCMLLNTGYDSPSTKCIIDCRPTKSIIQFIQRAGRIWRLNKGSEYGIYLDHASNVARHGFPEDIVPDCLDNGDKDFDEKKLTKKDEEEVKEPRACDRCGAIMVGITCMACGAKLPPTRKEIETVEGELRELNQIKINNEFYGGLLQYAKEKKYSEGWAAHKYKEKFGEFPTGAKPQPCTPSDEVKGYIKHLNIKRAMGKKYRKAL